MLPLDDIFRHCKGIPHLLNQIFSVILESLRLPDEQSMGCQNSHGQGPQIPGPIACTAALDDTNSAKRPR